MVNRNNNRNNQVIHVLSADPPVDCFSAMQYMFFAVHKQRSLSQCQYVCVLRSFCKSCDQKCGPRESEFKISLGVWINPQQFQSPAFQELLKLME